MLAAGLVILGAVATYTDLRARLIPNWLTGAGALGVVTWRLATGTGLAGLVGAGLAVGVLGLASCAARRAPGGGDWKYACVIGGALGPLGALGALGLAALGSTFWGLGLMIRRRGDWHTPLALAPFLAAGSCFVGIGLLLR
jgi:leader peptidase (prepilin peptidase)/N-methyltransferase